MCIRILTAISKWQYKCMYFKCNFKILKVNKKKKAINSQMSYLKTSKSRRTPKKKRKERGTKRQKRKKQETATAVINLYSTVLSQGSYKLQDESFCALEGGKVEEIRFGRWRKKVQKRNIAVHFAPVSNFSGLTPGNVQFPEVLFPRSLVHYSGNFYFLNIRDRCVTNRVE